MIDVNCLIVNVVSPYNVIFRWATINTLRVIVSIFYLTLKYSLSNGRVSIIRWDQQVARECYLSSMGTTREELSLVDVLHSDVPNTDIRCWDLRLGAGAIRLTPTEDLKEVHIGSYIHQVTKIVTFLSGEEERELVD